MNPGLDWRDSIYDSPTRGDVREGYPKSNCLELWERHKRFTHTLWGLFPVWIPYGFLVIEALIVGLHLPMNSVFVAIVPYALALDSRECRFQFPLPEVWQSLLRMGAI